MFGGTHAQRFLCGRPTLTDASLLKDTDILFRVVHQIHSAHLDKFLDSLQILNLPLDALQLEVLLLISVIGYRGGCRFTGYVLYFG